MTGAARCRSEKFCDPDALPQRLSAAENSAAVSEVSSSEIAGDHANRCSSRMTKDRGRWILRSESWADPSGEDRYAGKAPHALRVAGSDS